MTEERSVGEDNEDDEDCSSIGGYTPVDTMSQDGSVENEESEEEEEEEYETVTVTENDGANYDDKVDYGQEMDALQKMRGEL